MDEIFFRHQVSRLKQRFGDRAFDNEFVQLMAREVSSMSQPAFLRLVDVMIGSRSANKSPLLSDFREARLKEERDNFNNDVKGAANVLEWPAKGGLQRFLAKEYPGAKSLNEAVQTQILKNKIKLADDPDGAA